MDLLRSLSIESIAATILDFTDAACAELANIGATICSSRETEARSGIVLFELPGRSPQQIRKDCLAQGVAINCRAGRLRMSAHAYNNHDDLQRLLTVLRTAG
jgi:selenocysteine lyase/cysteine desulfurase